MNIRRVWVLAAIAGTALGVAFLAPGVSQPQDYHHFADARSLVGIPNAADTLSSLLFVIAGALGLGLLWRSGTAGAGRFAGPPEARAYWAFFVAVALIGIGSAYYHLAPDDARLVWDRLPISLALASLLTAVIAERVDLNAGRVLLVPLLALGVASVAYGRVSALAGAENLTPYVAFQFGCIALVVATAILFPSRYRGGSVFLWVVAAYAVAKLFEIYDREIWGLGHWIAGHTLKHIVSAAAALLVLQHLRVREIGV